MTVPLLDKTQSKQGYPDGMTPVINFETLFLFHISVSSSNATASMASPSLLFPSSLKSCRLRVAILFAILEMDDNVCSPANIPGFSTSGCTSGWTSGSSSIRGIGAFSVPVRRWINSVSSAVGFVRWVETDWGLLGPGTGFVVRWFRRRWRASELPKLGFVYSSSITGWSGT